MKIVVNPGGTNEKFIDNNIRRAKKIIVEDNRDIFRYIVEEMADLMITDKIEVDFQSARHPELCGLATDTTFTYQEKGYMIPREPELLAAINSWLEQAQQSGSLQAAFDRHL